MAGFMNTRSESILYEEKLYLKSNKYGHFPKSCKECCFDIENKDSKSLNFFWTERPKWRDFNWGEGGDVVKLLLNRSNGVSFIVYFLIMNRMTLMTALWIHGFWEIWSFWRGLTLPKFYLLLFWGHLIRSRLFNILWSIHLECKIDITIVCSTMTYSIRLWIHKTCCNFVTKIVSTSGRYHSIQNQNIHNKWLPNWPTL